MNTGDADKRTAIIAQSLYLANLLLLPGLAFIVLIGLFFKNRRQTGLAKVHLFRALQFSLLAGVAIVVIPGLILLISPQFQASLMMMILYFVTVHAALVMLGMLNLARAMSSRLPIF